MIQYFSLELFYIYRTYFKDLNYNFFVYVLYVSNVKRDLNLEMWEFKYKLKILSMYNVGNISMLQYHNA